MISQRETSGLLWEKNRALEDRFSGPYNRDLSLERKTWAIKHRKWKINKKNPNKNPSWFTLTSKREYLKLKWNHIKDQKIMTRTSLPNPPIIVLYHRRTCMNSELESYYGNVQSTDGNPTKRNFTWHRQTCSSATARFRIPEKKKDFSFGILKIYSMAKKAMESLNISGMLINRDVWLLQLKLERRKNICNSIWMKPKPMKIWNSLPINCRSLYRWRKGATETIFKSDFFNSFLSICI